MNSRLQSLFDSIEKQRHQILASLQNLPSEKLNSHLPNKWSINEIIAHLISSEKVSVRYISKKMLGIDKAIDTGWYEELKMLLLQISQRLPFKYRAPEIVIENTRLESDLAKLVEQWDSVRAELKTLLEKIEDHQLKRGIYRHLIVGLFNIQQALLFFGEHVNHHVPQIKRQL